MTNLNELIEIEEKLLKFEESDKFLIKFDVYLKLEKYLDEIGYITNKCFSLIKDYRDILTKQDLNLDAKSRIIENFKEQQFNCKIDYNIEEVKSFMKENNIE